MLALNSSSILPLLLPLLGDCLLGKGGTSWFPEGYDLLLTGPDGQDLATSQVKYMASKAPNKRPKKGQ